MVGNGEIIDRIRSRLQDLPVKRVPPYRAPPKVIGVGEPGSRNNPIKSTSPCGSVTRPAPFVGKTPAGGPEAPRKLVIHA